MAQVLDWIESELRNYLETGQKTVLSSGIRVQLHKDMPGRVFCIKALASNRGIIYVGREGTASQSGFELSPRESITLEIDNLDKVWIDASVDGEGVCWIRLA